MAKAMTKNQNSKLALNIHEPNLEDIIGLDEATLQQLDFTTLPVVVFDGEVFKVRNAEWGVPKSGFEAVILTMTPYWYYRGSDDHPIQGVYTYDDEMTTKGESLEEVLELWARDGVRPTKKEYMELKVLMQTPDEAKGGIAIVNISPTSVKRLVAYVTLDLKLKRKLHPRAAVTRFFPSSDKARGSNGKLYAPWSFQFVREFE